MHEYSIVSSLLERVHREAKLHPGAIVRTLHVRIGELAGVEVSLLRTAFETCRVRTPCESSELVIDQVPAVWHCPKCGASIAPPVRCPGCQAAARLASGDEIILERIELEVPDV
ncbi:MAG: hydrogenase maturation nickel metallochaperone HypA [Kofleriaceae bacterium]